jgi:hypothetical protein
MIFIKKTKNNTVFVIDGRRSILLKNLLHQANEKSNLGFPCSKILFFKYVVVFLYPNLTVCTIFLKRNKSILVNIHKKIKEENCWLRGI